MANYQQFDIRESSTGARVKSANRRTLLFNFDSKGAPINLPPGLSDPSVVLPYPGEPGQGRPAAKYWPVVALRRYRFKVSAIFSPNGGQQVLSLESAALDIMPVDTGGPEEVGYGKTASLSTTTALAANQLISIDDFVVDCDDLQSLASAGSGLGSFNSFQVLLRFMINNTGVALWTAGIPATWEYVWADYNSYRFDKWE